MNSMILNGQTYTVKIEDEHHFVHNLSHIPTEDLLKSMRGNWQDDILIQGDDGNRYKLSVDNMKIDGYHGLPKAGTCISFVEDIYDSQTPNYYDKYKPDQHISGTVISSNNEHPTVIKILAFLHNPLGIDVSYSSIH